MTQPDLMLPAPAKLNLFLHITGQRADGYHLLETLFQFLSVGDTLAFTSTNSGEVSLGSALPGVSVDDNLIIKAARLLLPYRGNNKAGVHIQLTKRLPMGGGLGGGSSDAATTLLALNSLWDIHLPLEKLAELGLTLGADVPIFIHGFAALARGVGEQLTPMQPAECWYLVVHPDVEVSTASIFSHPDLPRSTAPLTSTQQNWADHRNDCENLVKSLHPQVALAHKWLLEYGASRMTGTGACLFAPFTSKEAAQHALKMMPASFSGFVAQGLNTSPTHTALNAALAN